jgi:hypothetical protein
MRQIVTLSLALLLLLPAGAALAQAPVAPPDAPLAPSIARLETELLARYGEDQRDRLVRGMQQVAAFWRPEDGDAATFESFVRTHFAGDQQRLDAIFDRFQFALEQIDGHMLEINRELRRQVDLDLGPVIPLDQIFFAYNPAAHLGDDFFGNRLAFVALLNFPLTTLEQRLTEGDAWSRRQWAEARLAQRFSRRIPAAVNQAVSAAVADASSYIGEYNIWMHHVLDPKGNRLFQPGLRLISHWNLRDELKANYAEKGGIAKQRAIERVMERIVTQTIPAVVINNPAVDWNPFTNQVRPTTSPDNESVIPAAAPVAAAPEPDTRYAKLLGTFEASRLVDPYSPTAPTLIARRFDENREIPEARVREIFEQVLTSPHVPHVARLIEKRLGRRLEPFDIWYNGFRPRGTYTEAELDAITRKLYPTADAFGAALPEILVKLGFTEERARYLADRIVVDPSRGAGHAMGAARRGDRAHLRTRVEADGMNYKGYNIAIHELGHNVEQTFSLYDIDHTLLEGVPNTAFTEALAFVFQNRDLELLGLAKPTAQDEALKTLNDFWATYEIAGVAMVDMAVWHWMYDNPGATPAQLRDATVQISKDVWNRYYAPVFRKKDVVLLGIYSHMISNLLYTPDYPLGHLIAFQIEEQVKRAGDLGAEFERMSKIGNVTPDLWMKTATGRPVGPEALLAATERALREVR